MPMLVGAAAVAEERKLGTLAGQLCLPVKRRTQFAVKFFVAFLLFVFLGAVLPLLLEGTRILPNVHFDFSGLRAGMFQQIGAGQMLSKGQVLYWNGLDIFNGILPLLTLIGMAAGIGAISFYASTLARNTLQALAPAVLGIIIFAFLLFNASWPEFIFHYPVWHGPLIYFIGVPVFVVVLVALSFWNCQRTDPGGSVWRRNALVAVVTLALVMAVTTVIYHRAWEKLTPFEPAHGAARLTPSNPATLREQWNSVSVRLADGRIWTDDYALNFGAANPLALFLGDIRLVSLGDGRFYEGSNWVSVIRNNWQEQIGIKTDGSLWVSASPARRVQSKAGRWTIIQAGKMVQFGSETNWSSMIMEWPGVLLVQKNGTVWQWGSKNRDIKYNEWPGLKSFTPQRLGTESNWAEVFRANNQLCLRKTDGSVWIQWNGNYEKKIGHEVDESLGFSLDRLPLPAHLQWRCTTTARSGSEYYLSVGYDGTFRIWADQRLNQKSRYIEWATVDFQFGQDTNWLAVAGRGEKIVTLKDDGTLWLWPFYHDDWRGWDNDRDEREMLGRIPVRLGTHADWLAIVFG
jgi:hypothetical protein